MFLRHILPARRTNASTTAAADLLAAKAAGARSKRSIWANLGAVCLLALGMIFGSTAAYGDGHATAHFAGMQSVPAGGNFNDPVAVAVDAQGNFYVSDPSHSSVTEVVISNGGTITLGGGLFTTPGPLAVDANGAVFVIDSQNTIKRIPVGNGSAVAIGTISLTLGGSPFAFSSAVGIAVDASGNLFVSDTNNTTTSGAGVFEVTPTVPGDYSSVTVTQLGLTSGHTFTSGVAGVALDSSANLLILDAGSLYEIAPDSGAYDVVTTTAITGLNSTAKALALDSSNNIYIDDSGLASVLEFAAPAYTTSTQVGAGLADPLGVAVDSHNNVFIANNGASAITEIQFGAVNLGSTPVTSSITGSVLFTFDTGGTLNSRFDPAGNDVVPLIYPQFSALNVAASHSLEFADESQPSGTPTGTCDTNGLTHVYNAGDTCSVDVYFTPSYPSLRTGTVQLINDVPTVIASVNVYATGTGGQFAFSPAYIGTAVGTGTACPNSFTGPAPYCGDGGAATSATLQNPAGVAVSADGNIYVADLFDSLVRVVCVGGSGFCGGGNSSSISTLIGGNLSGTTAASPCPSNGSLTATDSFGDGCPAADSLLIAPTGVAVDAVGDVYVSDLSTGLVRELSAVNPSPGLDITTVVAGGGSGCGGQTDSFGDGCPGPQAALSFPSGIALDATGNVYIADQSHAMVRKVTAATGIITAVAGNVSVTSPVSIGDPCSTNSSLHATDILGDGCPATDPNVQIGQVDFVAVDASGNVFFSDTGYSVVHEVSAATGILTLAAGTSPLSLSGSGPLAFACNVSNTPTCGDGGLATGAELNQPAGVTVDAGGNLYITESNAGAPNALNDVRKVDAGGIITTIVGNRTACAHPTDACGDGAGSTTAQLNNPLGIALDSAANIYIADANDNRIREVGVQQSFFIFFNTPTAVGVADTSDGVPSFIFYNTGNTGLGVGGVDPGPSLSTASIQPNFGNPSLAPDFTIDNSTTAACNITTSQYLMPAGGDCTYGLDFTPQSAGGPGIPPFGGISDTLTLGINEFGFGGQVQATFIGATLPVPTLSGMVLSPSSSVAFGTSTDTTITETITYPTNGAYSSLEPTGLVVFTLNGQNYDALNSNCTGTPGSGTEVCSVTVSGSIIAALAVSGYPITASIAADANFSAGSDTTGTSLTITQQTPTFGTIGFSPSSLAFGDTAHAVTISVVVNYSGSTAPTGTFGFVFPLAGANYAASCVPGTGSSLNCSSTITAGNLSSLAVSGSPYQGTITYAGDTNFAANSANSGSFTVTKASQTITFTAPATNPDNVTFGVSPIQLTATGGASGNAVTFTIDGSSIGTGSIDGSNVLTVTGAGTIVIDANQTGNTNYNAAPQVQLTINVAKATQTITNFNTLPGSAIYGGSSIVYNLSSTGGASSNSVVYSIDGSSTASASITGGGTQVTITSAGTVIVDANQAADANYTAATQVQQTVTVSAGTPSLEINSTHVDPFYPGQTNASLTLTVDNLNGTANTNGSTITVTDTMPTGFTLVSATGTGWTCNINTPSAGVVTCTSTDVIAGDVTNGVANPGSGATDPNTITVLVNVANSAPIIPGALLFTPLTVIGGGSGLETFSAGVFIGQDAFIVSIAGIDPSTGTAASCATGSANACSLRDAIAAASAVQSNANGSTIPVTITFDSTDPIILTTPPTGGIFSTPQTISLSNGPYSLPSNTTIQGATSGSGLTLVNNVTLDGTSNGTNSLFNGFGVGDVLNNLNVTNATNSGNGGAIHNDFGSSLTINQSNFIHNQSSASGGAIFNNGTLTVNNSTISTNTASANGGGIYNESVGTLTVNYSTVNGNNANGNGGGIDSENNSAATTVHNTTITTNSSGNAGGGLHSAGPLTLTDSVVAQNNASIRSNDLLADSTLTQGGNVFNAASSIGTTVASGLSAFGSYGGPTKTFMAEPGGVAICAGTNASQPDAPFTTDQRGSSPSNFISVGHFCVDAGSTQSLYSLTFTTSPSLNGNLPNVALTPHPQVTLSETSSNVSSLSNGITVAANLTNHPGFTTGTTSTSTNSSGVAQFGNLQANAADVSETITATIPIGIYSLTATSSSFNVGLAAPTVAVSAVTAPFGSTSGVAVTATSSGSAGSADGSVVTFGVTGSATGSFSPTTCTIASGTCTVNYVPTGTLNAATYTNDITASFTAAGNYTAASATNTLTITTVAPLTAAVASVTATFGSTTGVSVDATEFGTAGVVTGGIVTFGVAGGVGGSFSPTTCTLNSVGNCTTPVTYTPSGTLAVGFHTNDITANFAAVGNYSAASASNTLNITKATPVFGTMTFSPAATEPFGTSQIITISDTLTFPAGVTAPTATNITYTLNGTGYSPVSCSVVTNVATCTATVPAATIAALPATAYTVTAAFATDTNYTVATGTSGTFTITTIAPTTATVSTVSAPFGSTAGVTVTATESGSGGAVTGGVVTFGIAGGVGGSFSPTTCTLPVGGSCTTTYTPSGTQPAGSYTSDITANFGAVGNYSVTSATNTLTITTIAPTTTTVSTVSAPFGSTAGVTVTATESGSGGVVTGGVVTFGVAGGVGGSFSPTTCTLPVGGSCTTTYTPSGTQPAGTYTSDITASFGAVGNYSTASASNTLTITTIAPTTTTVSTVSAPFGSTAGVTVTATESGSGGVVTGGVVTFGVAGGVGGSFSPTTCTLPVSGSCTTTYTPSGTQPAGAYTSDITASFGAVGNYSTASASNTLTITTIAPTTKTVSTVSASFGSTTGVTVTATESGSGGVVTGGVVTFGVAGGVGGSFSPTTCTLPVGGSCTTTYTPSGTQPAGSYTSDITASFGAVGNYAAASATNTLTITTVAPTTTTVSTVSAPFGSTAGVTVTAAESGTAGAVTGGVVTFGTAGGVGGSFSPTTCTLPVGGSCTTTYTPSGTQPAGAYTSDITASFATVGNYSAASASNTLTITTVAPTTATVSTVSAPFGSTAGVTVTATESGSGGVVTGGVVTFGVAGGVGGSFSPTTCTLPVGGSCTTTYTPSGTQPAGTYTSDITASFAAVGNYSTANASNTLTITTIAPTTITVSAVSAPAGSTSGVTAITATESGTGGVVTGGIVTFGVAGGVGGSFSPTTCTLNASGTCTTTVTYTPSGTQPAGTYPTDITASFSAVGNYSVASASNTLTITTVNPTTVTVSAATAPFGSTTGVTVTATESGGAGVVTGGIVTFGVAGGVGGSFSPTTCTLNASGTCTTSVTYTPSGTQPAGTYTSDITASFGAVANYNSASASNTLTITTIAPTTKTVSAVSAPAGSTTGVTVTATESGSGGVVTGGVVTFGTAGSATGTFSPATCTLPVGGSCSVNYVPTGVLAASTYTNDITANFGAVGNYAAASTTNTLTITTVAPTTTTVSALLVPAGSTTGITVTATESGAAGVVTGGVVTFGVANGATGTFSPTTCTLSAGGTCTTSYVPTGILAAGTYTNGITASFGAINNYNSASASNNIVVGSVTPTVSVNAVSSVYGTATGVTVTANESGTAGAVTGGVVTFGTAGGVGGSFSPTTCTLPVGGSCSVTYNPTGTLTAGTYASDITGSFTAAGNYAAASATGTLSITQAGSTVVIAQIAPSTVGSIGTGVSSTFTATVTNSSANSTGSPTGTVNFFDGATQLNGSAITLTSGVATITGVTFSTVTTHSITAVYSGDANFTANTSAPLSENVVVPAFSVSATPNSLTIAQGNSATTTLTFTPVGNYQGSLALNCTGLPAFASCQFLPATITFTGNNAVQTTQLTVFTLNAHAAPGGSSQNLLWFPAAGMLAGLIAIRRRKLARRLRPLLMVAIAALAMTALTGCGTGATFVTPTGVNIVTVTANATATAGSGSSSTTQTTTITITITQ